MRRLGLDFIRLGSAHVCAVQAGALFVKKRQRDLFIKIKKRLGELSGSSGL
jgi:hypothetical protein